MFRKIIDFILHPLRKCRLWLKFKKFIDCIETGLMDDFLELLLSAMRIMFCFSHEYRKNIEGFNGRYTFKSKDGRIAASAIIANNKMTVKKKEIPDTNVTVVFEDANALFHFLVAADPDVFAFMLENKLNYNGNLNYIMKFAYMAKHLKFMLERIFKKA